MSWRDEVLEPTAMSDGDLRSELRHDLSVHNRVRHPISRAAIAARIGRLVDELDRRSQAGSGDTET